MSSTLGGITFGWSVGRPQAAADRSVIVQGCDGTVGVVRVVSRADNSRPVTFWLLATGAGTCGAEALRGKTVACAVPGYTGQVVVDAVVETPTPIIPVGASDYLIRVDTMLTGVA